MIARIAFFIGIFLTSIFATPLLLIPAAILYSTQYFAPELLIVGLLIDTYFGAASGWPWYTIGAFLIVLGSEIAKRYLFLKMVK